MRYAIAIVLALLCTSIFSGTIDPYTPDAKYIQYGSKFRCVVKMVGKTHDDKTYIASAVVIDKNWVLTAAHVVQGCESISIVDDVGKQYRLDKVIMHEQFDDNSFGISDIAIGYSKEDINCNFFPELYDNKDEVGKICSIAGYGLTGNFNTGSFKSDGNKRAGSNMVDKIDRDLLICTPSAHNSKDRTELEFIICHGDSGGGLFIDKKLAGINSCVIADDRLPNSDYGDESGHTRISTYVEWIKNHIKNPPKDSSQANMVSFESHNSNLIILGVLTISLNIIFFCLGYGWCKIISLKEENTYNNSGIVTKNNIKTPNMQLAAIDDTKVVVNIKTDGLEKKYDQLGEVSKTEDSISSSVDKLKNLRK
jgi:hypothetical protein